MLTRQPSVLEPALEGAAVCLDLGKSSSFHAVCQASKRAKEMEKYSDLEPCETNSMVMFSVVKEEK